MKRKYNFEIKNAEKFASDLHNKPFVEIPGEDIWELGFDTKPIIEYEKPENFPNCCENHKSSLNDLNSWYDKFPKCCEYHTSISERSWFKKELFNHVPEKILLQYEYTTNFILGSLNKKNWYKEITDYIEYTSESFGIPGIGEDKFHSMLLHWLKNTKQISEKGKKKKIISFLIKRRIPNKSKTDLNNLYSTFQKWVKALPSLPFFKQYKINLTNKLPLSDLLYSPEYNRFTGDIKFKCKTHEELLDLLIETTKKLLSSINTTELLKGKHISEVEKQKIDIRNEQHDLEQNKLLVDYSRTEIKYVTIIKKWLKNEKKYLKDLEKLFSSNTYLANNNLEGMASLKDLVFVSYSWDNEEHKDQILSLCLFLRKNGFNCEIDRSLSQKETSIDFRKMMQKSINESKKVIIILSEGYKIKAEQSQGGVGIEYEMILNEINNTKTKYLLASFCELSDQIVPSGFKDREVLDISKKENYNYLFSKLKDEPIIDFGEISKNQPKIIKKCISRFE